ncbi:MAG TPA: NAD(P)/FAD-dependent oxidoreductase [Acidimicrobiales bacterium]
MAASPVGGYGRAKVVVVGGGFAGLAAVSELRDADADVLLLDRDPYNTFQPLLYQVATGGLNPGDVTYALRAFTSRFPNARFRRACVTHLDPDARRLRTDTGDEIDYDFLVLCCGVTANYFGIPGAAEHARTIYSRAAAIHVRDRVMGSFEAAAQRLPGAVEPVIVIVGAGATGVEMAGTLAELRNTVVRRIFPELDPGRVRVVLVEMADEVLAPFAPKLRAYAADELRKRGVELRLGTAVTEVGPDSVTLEGGETLPSAVTIWATGVKAHDQISGWGLPQGKNGRILVGADMRVRSYPEVFAVGDIGMSEDEALPQLAQPAIQGGRHAGVAIRHLLEGRPTEPLAYKDKGTMATIGRSDAVVQFPNGFTLRGRPAWAAWAGLHIVMLMGNRNRFATMVNLAARYLAWPGGTNLILGDPP